MRADCSDCGALLDKPKNVTHTLTEMDTMVFAMNCGSCNAMNEVALKVAEINRV